MRGPARFLSLSFHQPLGQHFIPGELGGYYIDMRVKAPEPRWPPVFRLPLEDTLWVDRAQWGLACFEHFAATREPAWLDAARGMGEHLVKGQAHDGGWPHRNPYPHTFRLDPPWLSSMAQGEGASLLVRLHVETGDERYAEAALRALGPLSVPASNGGVRAELYGHPFPEEYPTTPPSFVLNGAIFSLWGLYDVAAGLGDGGARLGFTEGLDALAANIGRWDTGYWSRYDLYPHKRMNVASFAYHTLHIDQLEAMQRLEPRPEIAAALGRFRRYARSPVKRSRAFAAKVAFRLAVPRGGS